jgi:predicted dehydrogenase/threonine dehydrogenase-like Zn-dependent dehydrogenase
MKQVLQSLETGVVRVEDVPASRAGRGELLIATQFSLLSAGTERMLLEFGRGSLLSKARQQPEKVRQVLQKMSTDGVVATLDAVRSKLDQPLAPGYCNVGQVIGLGSDIHEFSIGDRVVSNGRHAEVVAVPRNLSARIPAGVEGESAAFTVMAAIGLQGVRLAGPTIGECVAVTGLGLIGLITVQILRAQGCRVLGIDVNPARLAMARQFGAEVVDLSAGEDALAVAQDFSRGRGLDAVLITASTTSSEPVSQAAKLCRKRGRIVLVGVTGLELSRADFYEKELTFQVSCSYGPGRYDPAYEQQGHDYPVGYVRWTEQRNFEAVLDLMASGALDMKPLISHRFDVDDAPRAYDLLVADEPSLGIVLRYPGGQHYVDGSKLLDRTIALEPSAPGAGRAVAGFIGAGNYGGRVLISAFREAGAELYGIASAGGVSAVHYGKKFSFREVTTDAGALIAQPQIDLVVISTRHDTHADFVEQSLREGKNVFVEKPLCLTLEELERIRSSAVSADARLMVGFNRRFAPHIVRIRELLRSISTPKAFLMTVNAGVVPRDHWLQDPVVGGGRLLGEGCHFVDLLRHLAGSPITAFNVHPINLPGGPPRPDNAAITLRFADGSTGTIHYLSNGHKSVSKERLEIFCGGRVLQLDNFRKLQGWGWQGFSSMNLWRQDKGQSACAAAFVHAVRSGGPSPIPLEELLEVSRVSIEIAELSAGTAS